MMLHHNGINGVTGHVTNGYRIEKFVDRAKTVESHNRVMGENNRPQDGAANKKYYNDRHSTDVDDGVNSSDGDYDAAGYNLEALELVDNSASAVAYSGDKSTEIRLSHAESTDSGMGFSDNVRDGDASRLSGGDGYGTIHIINPPPLEELENRKSILDGDVEYDEVLEFISTPVDQDCQKQQKTTFSTFKTPPKKATDDTQSQGDSASKYAELDLAKILHTRRRHRHASTLGRRLTEEERWPDENGYNSLKRKGKSKNHSISTYGTYGRNRKSSKQQISEANGSRPPSTYDEDSIHTRSDSMSSGAFNRRSSKSSVVENTFGHYNTLTARRNNYSSDLMMTSDVSDDIMNGSATIDRTVWNRAHDTSLAETENSSADVTKDSNRWSWLSGSSQAQSFSNEKALPSSKSPWKIFRRLFKSGDKRKSVIDGSMSPQGSSSPRPRSTSLFRRFSMRRSNKNNLGRRRNSVPAKSEWDVQNSMAYSLDNDAHVPVIDARKERPVAPKSLSERPRGRLSSRLMSFRGGKSRNSKRNDAAISKGLSISSPQLSVHAIDPTRNYSEHQLLNLENLSIRDGTK